MSFNTLPPSGLDRADGSLVSGLGTGLMPGTPTIGANATKTFIATNTSGVQPTNGYGDGSFFEEFDDSPQFDFGEKGTVRHRFRCDALTFQNLIPVLQRGTVQYDSFGDSTIILNTTAEFAKPGYYILTVTSEGTNWGLPPDEFRVEPVEINPDLMKHPRYNYGPAGQNSSTGYGLSAQQKMIIRQALNSNAYYSTMESLNRIFTTQSTGLFPGGNVTWSTPQEQMAWEIIQKTYRGEDTFYLPALVVTYSKYFSSPYPMNPGGYIEDPVTSGSIPYFFWSLDGTDNYSFTNDILQYVPSVMIGNLYANGVSYLRKADTFVYDMPLFKLTSTWVGAPTGPKDQNGDNYINWDPDLYAAVPTPLGALPA